MPTLTVRIMASSSNCHPGHGWTRSRSRNFVWMAYAVWVLQPVVVRLACYWGDSWVTWRGLRIDEEDGRGRLEELEE